MSEGFFAFIAGHPRGWPPRVQASGCHQDLHCLDHRCVEAVRETHIACHGTDLVMRPCLIGPYLLFDMQLGAHQAGGG